MDNDEALRMTAGTVRDVAQVLLEAVKADEDEEDLEGYSEGGEDFSCNIDMVPNSGNATPVPTQVSNACLGLLYDHLDADLMGGH